MSVQTDGADRNLKNLPKLFSQFFASAIAKIFSQVILLVISSRILTPSEFGVAALFLAVGALFEVFLRFGLTQSFIKSQDGNQQIFEALHAFYSTVTAMACIGVTVAYSLSGWTVTDKYLIAAIFLCISTCCLLFSTLYSAKLSIQGDLATIAKADAVSVGAGNIVIGIPLLYMWPEWPALIFLKLVRDFLLLLFYRKEMIRPCLLNSQTYALLLPLLRNGIKFLFTKLLSVGSLRIHDFLIPATLGLDNAGLFNRAYAVGNIPIEIANSVFDKALFPIAAGNVGEAKKIPAVKNFSIFIFIGLAFFCLLVGYSIGPIASFLLGDQWVVVIDVLSIFTCFSIYRIGYKFIETILKARSSLNFTIFLNIFQLIASALGILSFSYLGLMGVVLALGLTYLVKFLISLFIFRGIFQLGNFWFFLMFLLSTFYALLLYFMFYPSFYL